MAVQRLWFLKSYNDTRTPGVTQVYVGGHFYMVEDDDLAAQLLADGTAQTEEEHGAV